MRKILYLILGGAALAAVGSSTAQDWRNASRAPMGWAPDPATYKPAVVQAYAARTVRWRGNFAVHCWIAVKPEGASEYHRYEVTGWNLRGGGTTAIRDSFTTTPDQRWYGAEAELLQDIRGAEAEKIIAALPAAVASYPHPNTYRIWPGPNSNTFIAHIAREIPDLRLALPNHAIGKDYTGWQVIASAPSGTGFQVSLGGVFGVMLAADEGVEINILGLVFGADPSNLALKLPLVGRFPGRVDWTNGKAAQAAEAKESAD